MCQLWNPNIPPKIPPINPTIPPKMPPINPMIPPNTPTTTPNTIAASAIQNGKVIMSIRTSKTVGVRDIVLRLGQLNKNHSKMNSRENRPNLRLWLLLVLKNEHLILQIRTKRGIIRDALARSLQLFLFISNNKMKRIFFAALLVAVTSSVSCANYSMLVCNAQQGTAIQVYLNGKLMNKKPASMVRVKS